MTSFQIYLMMQADGFGAVLIIAGLIAPILGIMFICCISTSDNMTPDEARKIKKLVIVGSLLFITGIAIPSTKTVAMMYALPKIEAWATSDEVTEEAKEVYELLKGQLKEKDATQ